MMRVTGIVVILSVFLPVLVLRVGGKPSQRAYDVPDIDEDIMPPAPRGAPFQEEEIDAMTYILNDNDPIEQEIVDGEIAPILIDGDIYEPVHNESSRSKRNAVKGRDLLWPGGLVPYVISPYFHTDSKLAVLAAMQRFHDKTCIRFRPRTVERDFLYIGPGRGCWSLVGRQTGRQTMSLGATCKTKRGTIMHELMHVIGFRHEHNRPDRDRHVVIYWENIAKAMEINFKKYPSGSVDLLGVNYDFGSIMHYPMYAFSKNGAATLSPRYTTYQEIGFRNDFSDLDVYRINRLYKCGACQDTDPTHCPTWAMGGSCHRNYHWMTKNCAFSCMRCKTNSYGACSDHHQSCTAWAKVGECTRNPPWMKKTCPLTCGGCPMDLRNRRDEMEGCHDKNTLCYDWALIGECHANKGFMSKMCRLSCSLCDDEEIATTNRRKNREYCHDQSGLCNDWAYLNECRKNRGYMQKRCKYSCGYCQADDKTPNSWTFMGPKACINRHPTCTEWAKHNLCETYSSWMYPNCPESCNKCPNKDTDNDHLRPTLSSEDLGNVTTANSSVETNLTIPEMPDGVEVQPLGIQALEPLEVEVVQATEPPIEILQLENNTSSDNECHDRDGRCVIWADEGRCRKANRFMYDYCRYSCDLCDVDEFQLKDVCRDIHGFCSIYAQEGECEQNEEWMRIYCKKACGFCKRSAQLSAKEPSAYACADRSTRCSLMVARGDCEKARERMRYACPRSCRFCGGVKELKDEPDEDCRDRNRRCPKWAKAGDCTTYDLWMRVNCPQSCDSCDNLTYDRECMDTYRKCPAWASAGDCNTNDWMKLNCRFSCDSCDFTVSNPNCTDRFKRCKFQAESGACAEETSAKWMTKNCHRSCNLCDSSSNEIEFGDWAARDLEAKFDDWDFSSEISSYDWSSDDFDESNINSYEEMGECRDRNPFCPTWAAANQCVYNPSVMRKECKESCNLCPKGPDCVDQYDTKECKRWAWQGECLSNPEGTHKICKKSCGVCGPREGCRDLNRRCIKWSKAGHCTNKTSAKFMKKFCGPSCGVCTPSAEEIQESKNVIGSEQGAPKKKRVKRPPVTTPAPPTTTKTTTAPPAPTEAPAKKSKKSKKKKNRSSKKNSRNKKAKKSKGKKKANRGSAETRQFIQLDSDTGRSAMRPDSREIPAWKLARLRKRLEEAKEQSRTMEERRAMKIGTESGEIALETSTEIEKIQGQIQLNTLANPVDTRVDPIQDDTENVQEQVISLETATSIENIQGQIQINTLADQDHQDDTPKIENGDQNTDTL